MSAEKEPKRGRKPLGDAARKRVLQVRVTERQYARMIRKCGSAGAREILVAELGGEGER